MSIAENIYQAICSCPDECKLHGGAESCGQADRDADLLAMLEPEITYYGPHPCESCGKRICKVAKEQGSMVFDYPEGIIYPNTNWVQHVCVRAVAPVETSSDDSSLRRSHPASEGRSAEPGPRVGPPSASSVETRLTAEPFIERIEELGNVCEKLHKGTGEAIKLMLRGAYDEGKAFRDKSESDGWAKARELYKELWEAREEIERLKANRKRFADILISIAVAVDAGTGPVLPYVKARMDELTKLRAKLAEQEWDCAAWHDHAVWLSGKLVTAEAELAALREAALGIFPLVEFYAERDMKSPANHQEFVRETQKKLDTFRKALSAAPEPGRRRSDSNTSNDGDTWR